MPHQMSYNEWLARNPDAQKTSCPDCNGVGFFDCGECDATGIAKDGMFCENCEDGELFCQNCGGWGHLGYQMYEEQKRRERRLLEAWTGLPTESTP